MRLLDVYLLQKSGTSLGFSVDVGYTLRVSQRGTHVQYSLIRGHAPAGWPIDEAQWGFSTDRMPQHTDDVANVNELATHIKIELVQQGVTLAKEGAVVRNQIVLATTGDEAYVTDRVAGFERTITRLEARVRSLEALEARIKALDGIEARLAALEAAGGGGGKRPRPADGDDSELWA